MDLNYLDNIKKYLENKLFLFFLVFLILLSACHGWCESFKSILPDNPDIPWEIKAEQVEYDPKNKIYIAKDGVTISKGRKKLSADFVQFNHKTMNAHAQGNVIMSTGEDILTGTRMDIDLNNETGIIYNANIFIKENHFYIKGETIEKVGKDDYKAYKASITSCSNKKPAWKITGKNLDVTIEGYATIKHAALWANDIPVIYTPFLIFPVKNKRQSGLLTPELGYSDRKGAEYNQPLFWAINENSDATFYNYYMSKRGNKIGLEYRYIWDDDSKISVMYDFLDDDKTDKTNNDYGYDGDNVLRSNSDRYWFRMKADHSLAYGISSRLDIDIVSDQDYLYEFQSGYSGFNKTRQYFDSAFGRDLDDYNDPVRSNSLSFHKIWKNYSLNAKMLWYDNVINRRWEDTDTTLHQLPFITLNSSRQPISGTPLYWNTDIQYVYFYRIDGSKAHRSDINPRISLPYKFKNYFSFEPSLGLRETLWYVEKYENNDLNQDKNQHREMADAKLDISTNIFKIYNLNLDKDNILKKMGLGPKQFKHNIRPQVTYEYVPDKNQDKYPYFDNIDRLEQKNRITFSIIQNFISKSLNKKSDKYNDYSYKRFCRFLVQQSYDFNKYTLDDFPDEYDFSDQTTPEENKHFSPLYAELEITPAKFFSLEADSQWSHAKTSFLSHNTACSFWDTRGDRIFIEHRYTKALNESIYMNLKLKISKSIFTYGEYERNIRDDENMKTGMGMLYNSQCWSLSLRYLKDTDDQTYGFMVNLYGLGGLGTK